MNNDPLNQAITQLRKSRNILVLVGQNADVDVLASAVALKEFLSKLEIKTRILTSSLPNLKLKLLDDPALNQSEGLSKNLVLEVNLGKTQLSELSYQKQEDKLSIYLLPKSGEFTTTDVTVKTNVYPFDLVVTLGVANLEELGPLQAGHAQLFFETPVINLDYKPSNENYGQINLVSLTSAGVSEVLYDLLNTFDPEFIDEKIATLILTGLVAQTNSFQSIKTTPQVFNKASKLVSLGAKQQEIVSQLYKSKSLGLLRLWGRALARIKHDAEKQIVSTMTSQSDVERAEASKDEVDQIIYEMMEQLSFGKTFVFLNESGKSTQVTAFSRAAIDFKKLFGTHGPTSAQGVYKFTIDKPIAEAETEVIETLKKVL